jgi:septal ring factor EnvC (AmiA/AmiB activator)
MRASSRMPTRKLASARLEFSSDRRFTHAMLALAVAAVVAAAGTVAWQSYVEGRVSGTVLQTLTQQNTALRAEVSRMRTELALERSTRAELAQQVADLNEEKRELERRLAFFNAQTARPGRTR